MSTVSREEAQVTHIRGPGMPLLRAAMLATLPVAKVDALRTELQGEALAFLDHPVAEAQWVPLPVVLEVEAAFLALSEVDPFPAHGALMAHRMLENGLEGMFLNWMGYRTFLRLLPLAWSRYNRGGRVELDLLGEREAAITLWADYPTPYFVARVLPSFARAALVRLGAPGAEVVYLPPGPGEPGWRHRYRITWQAEA